MQVLAALMLIGGLLTTYCSGPEYIDLGNGGERITPYSEGEKIGALIALIGAVFLLASFIL